MGSCTAKEVQKTWNQVGQQGPQGASGRQGASGPQGPSGPPGAPGATAPAIPAGSSGGALVPFGDFVGLGLASAIDDQARQVLPVAATLSDLGVRIYLSSVQPEGFTIAISGNPETANSMSCTIPAGAESCSDTVHIASVAPGDAVSLYYNITSRRNEFRAARFQRQLVGAHAVTEVVAHPPAWSNVDRSRGCDSVT
jgi:hypothetical protein